MDITPKDSVETKALNIGQRISAAIGIIIAMGSALLAAFGDVKWISDNLPLLGTGVGALVTGGLTSYVAIRRMRVDKLGKASVLFVLLVPCVLFLSGCAVMWNRTPIMSESNGETVVSDAVTLKWGFGTKDATTADSYKLSADGGLDISGLSLKSDSSASLIQGMQLGMALAYKYLQLKGLAPEASADDPAEETPTVTPAANKVKVPKVTPKKATVKKAKTTTDAQANAASQASEADDQTSEVSDDPSSDSSLLTPNSSLPAGYTGSPASDGSGVYGRPTCSRCRAYKAAHPDAPLINLDEPANRAAMWSALKARGFTGTTASLPVLITSSAYTQPAK